MNYAAIIAQRLELGARQVERTVELLEQGATVPFIARYRKEVTGSLNEVQIAAIRDLLLRLKELDKRREAVLQSIKEQGKLTDELHRQIQAAETLTDLEDLYLPYRPKRRTRATIAIEKGYEPLADAIMSGKWRGESGESEEDLQYARDIIAERISEDAVCRNRVRNIFRRKAMLSSALARGVKEDDERVAKFESWIDWKEPIGKAPSHRILALFRGEEAGVLKVHVRPDSDSDCIASLHTPQSALRAASSPNLGEQLRKQSNSSPKLGEGDRRGAVVEECVEQMNLAVADSYKRLIGPSIENEFRNILKEKADREAIRVFAENLRQLLLAAPMGQKRTLAIDPGFRTGCKVVCLDAQGQLLHNETIYPFTSVREERAAVNKLEALVEAFQIEAIAIGNGTAGRETEEVVQRCRFKNKVIAVSVSEAGASVYSASDVARREFPDYDVTVRGAVSIGRRLMDPLSELVKIDPKSIGVGQYQHDVDQKMLADSLSDTVVSCVNSVGVELNTASRELLSYVSGIGPALADKIVEHRNRNGAFADRQALKQVKGLGDKAFEQCAGFLRVRASANPLDRSAVHPERYALVERMAASVGADVQTLMNDKELRAKIHLDDFVGADCGMPTLQDIMHELEKPGLDPRARFEVFEFDKNVTRIEDVQPGMVLPGIVTNITAFGAFVDIGVHQDGLVHVSQMANRRVNDPAEVVHLHQHLKVKVLDVDLRRHRISLTLKGI